MIKLLGRKQAEVTLATTIIKTGVEQVRESISLRCSDCGFIESYQWQHRLPNVYLWQEVPETIPLQLCFSPC